MSSADEPMDDWERGEQAANRAFTRGALRAILPALVIIVLGLSVHFVTLIFGVLGVATLPRPWISLTVFYLVIYVAVETAISTKIKYRSDPDDAHRVVSKKVRWRRRIISRVASLPLAYLMFRALDSYYGIPTIAIVIAGLFWVTPIVLALFHSDSLTQRLRTLRAFMRGNEKNGPEI